MNRSIPVVGNKSALVGDLTLSYNELSIRPRTTPHPYESYKSAVTGQSINYKVNQRYIL